MRKTINIYNNRVPVLNIIVIWLIKIYKFFISPLPGIGSSCRFYPTCSLYAIESYKNFGFFRGSFLTIKRLLKCHPFGGKGYDPVPQNCKRIKIKQNSRV